MLPVKAEIIVSGCSGRVAEDALKTAALKISPETVIDVTNPISTEPPDDGVLKYFTAERSSWTVAGLHRRPILSSLFLRGESLHVNPHFSEGKPTMFNLRNSAEAKREVTQILDLFVVSTDLGTVKSARRSSLYASLVHTWFFKQPMDARVKIMKCNPFPVKPSFLTLPAN